MRFDFLPFGLRLPPAILPSRVIRVCMGVVVHGDRRDHDVVRVLRMIMRGRGRHGHGLRPTAPSRLRSPLGKQMAFFISAISSLDLDAILSSISVKCGSSLPSSVTMPNAFNGVIRL